MYFIIFFKSGSLLFGCVLMTDKIFQFNIVILKMYTTSQFALKWSDFSEHLIGSYRNATEDTEFCDVTLVCEDDQQMEAHKVILAAASPVFKSMLKRSKHPHPLVFMKGIKIADLSAILNFIYIGQTNIDQDNIGKFLALAESLKVKGLETEANPKENINPNVDSHKQFQEHVMII